MKLANFRIGLRLRDIPMLRLLLLPLAVLALCVAAGAQLDAALAAWLQGMTPGVRTLILANVTLAALVVPPLCAAGLLWHGRGFLFDEEAC